jgi:glycosyltransferase involved in cell wall biosynthesis
VRILILNWKDLAHPAAGGAEVFTEEVARSLVARGHDVTLFASSVDARPARELVQGVEIVRGGGRLGVYRAARRFWSRLPPGSVDVVIDEINTRPFLTPRWIRGTPVVALIHQLAREVWSYEVPFPLSVAGRYVLEPWWLRSYRDVPAMTVSRSSAESLRRYHGWKDVTILPEGSTVEPAPLVARESEPTVVFVARLVAMKRPLDAVEAFSRLRARVPDAKLWVIGDGPLRDRLRAAAPDGVSILGRVGHDELRARLARAHVLVATSVREGWGLSVSEAAACGTPAIAYDVPGLADAVPASGGALVDPSPDALGAALVDFFSGTRPLHPTVSTVPWAEVAALVEQRLEDVARRASAGGAGREAAPRDEPETAPHARSVRDRVDGREHGD